MEAKKIGPKFYADVNKTKPPEYSDYENLEITWGKQEDYEVIKKINKFELNINKNLFIILKWKQRK
jgi:hypothetical protein